MVLFHTYVLPLEFWSLAITKLSQQDYFKMRQFQEFNAGPPPRVSKFIHFP